MAEHLNKLGEIPPKKIPLPLLPLLSSISFSFLRAAVYAVELEPKENSHSRRKPAKMVESNGVKEGGGRGGRDKLQRERRSIYYTRGEAAAGAAATAATWSTLLP